MKNRFMEDLPIPLNIVESENNQTVKILESEKEDSFFEHMGSHFKEPSVGKSLFFKPRSKMDLQ